MTLGSILDLQFAQRETDAGILLRSMYEDAVHFAWLGAEPSASRIGEWRRHDLVERLKADSDALRHGVHLFTDADRANLKAQVEGMHGSELVLTNLAAFADSYWVGRLPGLAGKGEVQSFRSLYALLYRHYSGVAHPTARGLNRVIDDLSRTRRRVRLEGEYQGNGPYGLATVIFALALYVAAQTLSWLRASEVDAIFERYS